MGLLSPIGLLLLAAMILNVIMLAAASVRGRRPQQLVAVLQFFVLLSLELILLQVKVVIP